MSTWRKTEVAASEVLRGELAYQADRLGKQIAQSSSEIVSAVEQGSFTIVDSIQRMSDYLGAGLYEVRWAVERHSQISYQILKLLLNSRENDSRQCFEQGLKCYEVKENGMAKECFIDAVKLNKTNHFAYQYLGFLAVAEDNATEAFRNFDLARKFAENNYHRALALSHLARSHHAADELIKAADLARSATETYPELAKFWYELAGYSARLGRVGKAIEALTQAIGRDWMFFTVVVGDHDFDAIRADVIRLLDSLRERERVRAKQSLDTLGRAIDVFRKVGAGPQIGDLIEARVVWEMQYKQNNVYLYREITSKANDSYRSIVEIAEEKVIPQKTKAVSENEHVERAKIHELRTNLSSLEQESRELELKDIALSTFLEVLGLL